MDHILNEGEDVHSHPCGRARGARLGRQGWTRARVDEGEGMNVQDTGKARRA